MRFVVLLDAAELYPNAPRCGRSEVARPGDRHVLAAAIRCGAQVMRRVTSRRVV
jgi:hypothetical protein